MPISIMQHEPWFLHCNYTRILRINNVVTLNWILITNIISQCENLSMHLSGLQLQAISTGVQACMSLLAKLLNSHGHGVFQIVLFRSLILLHFAMYLMWHDVENPFASSRYGVGFETYGVLYF